MPSPPGMTTFTYEFLKPRSHRRERELPDGSLIRSVQQTQGRQANSWLAATMRHSTQFERDAAFS